MYIHTHTHTHTHPPPPNNARFVMLRGQAARGPVGVEPALEDELRGHLIDDLVALGPGEVRFEQGALGRHGGQPLVQNSTGSPSDCAGRVGELARGLGARALAAIHVERQAHHEA